MRTAIASNVISALWSTPAFAPQIAAVLGAAQMGGGLVVSAPEHAELLVHPKLQLRVVDDFLSHGHRGGIRAAKEHRVEAGLGYARYATRQRRSTKETPG